MSAKTENQDHHTTMSGLKKKKECQYVLPQMSGFAAVLQTRVRRFLALLNHEATGRRRKKKTSFYIDEHIKPIQLSPVTKSLERPLS